MERIRGDVFIGTHPVKLTPEEIVDHGDALAKANIDREQAEKDKANITKQFAAKITAYEAAIASHSMFITTKEEWRDVECQWVFDFDESVKDLIRLDTGEILESRKKVSDNDRQTMLKIPKQ